MKIYIFLLVFIIESMCVFAQDTLLLDKSSVKRQQDSIYFDNILNDGLIEQEYHVSVNVKTLTYTGKVIMGALRYQYLLRNELNASSMDSNFPNALQLLLNNDTLRIANQSLDFEHGPYNKLRLIPIVEEYAAKGQEAFLSFFFVPSGKDWSFIKERGLLLSKSSDREWVDLQKALIYHLINWRFYCRHLHSEDGRLLCYKEFVPPPYPRKRRGK